MPPGETRVCADPTMNRGANEHCAYGARVVSRRADESVLAKSSGPYFNGRRVPDGCAWRFCTVPLGLWVRFGFVLTPLLAAILDFVRPYETQGNSKGMRTQGCIRRGRLRPGLISRSPYGRRDGMCFLLSHPFRGEAAKWMGHPALISAYLLTGPPEPCPATIGPVGGI
jgi:hypothetical protein